MKSFLLSALFFMLGILVLVYGINHWIAAFDLIVYAGVGLGLMIIPMRLFFFKAGMRSHSI